jgi:type VI secretion system protein ImpK
MRDDIANVVYPVLSHGLRLKDRLTRGESPNLSEEQAILEGLLNQVRRFDPVASMPAAAASVRDPNLSVRLFDDPSPGSIAGVGAGGGGGHQFLGMRYALACWLDEILGDSPVGEWWKNHTLERKLFQKRERAVDFWKHAGLAESLPSSDALETYYLCAMLGFRGEYGRTPERLASWRREVETRLDRAQSAEPASPPDGEPPINVPPLRGRERLRSAALALGALLALLIPLIAFYLVSRLS